ncbi:MAG TPA: saccharopine dehydrogenase NADP-binding domain-containing protein [Longimicrobiales bacterium]|nr:saccharopine dehydrogenase NADP-binding domain-containing protein [Longimicrobiales bacterium]
MTTAAIAPWILYGAYGFTGRLMAREAVTRGLSPILAGRDEGKVEELAGELGLAARVFGLDDPDELRRGIRGAALVLHAAGPFSRTGQPMAAACLAEGVHYLDITGEIDVLEGIHELDARARAAGIHMVPAVGFDVVPTDCAAALAAEALSGATALDLAFVSSGGPSRGTARTALERMDQDSAVRRNGKIVSIPLGSVRRTIPFSDRPREGVAIPWGDVSTAWRSTWIPDIRVFAVLPPRVLRIGRVLGLLLELPLLRGLVRAAVDALVSGPDDEELAQGSARIWAEARREGEADDGSTGTARAQVELVTPNGYTLTARASVEAARRILDGQVRTEPGVHTPSRAFGADFVLGLDGVKRVV